MDLSASLRSLQTYVERKDYSGYCKFDALNSPFAESLFGSFAVTRLLITQLVNRVPFPLRKILRVEKRRNPKGIANFIKGYCELNRKAPSPIYRKKIVELCEWLLTNDSANVGNYRGKGLAWGYQFPWQSPGFFAPRFFPNCIVTTFCGDAMLAAYREIGDPRYLAASEGAKNFLLQELPVLEETPDVKCIGYVSRGLKWKVININAVVAGFLAKLAKEKNDNLLMADAKKLIEWVLRSRTPKNTWNYTTPKNQSGIGPDNYHTGGILDGIYDYMSNSGDESAKEIYFLALQAYQENFFGSDGAPFWRIGKRFPQDVHGAAQGILTFARAGNLDPRYLVQSSKIADWAHRELQDRDGYFYYQKRRFFTWKIDLMRWNNSWMFWALADYQSKIGDGA